MTLGKTQKEHAITKKDFEKAINFFKMVKYLKNNFKAHQLKPKDFSIVQQIYEIYFKIEMFD